MAAIGDRWQHAGVAFKAARRLSDDAFKGVALPLGVSRSVQAVIASLPQKKQRAGGAPVPSIGKKCMSDPKDILHEASISRPKTTTRTR